MLSIYIMSRTNMLDYGLYRVYIHHNVSRPDSVISSYINQNVAMYNFYCITRDDTSSQVVYSKTYIPGRRIEESTLSNARYLIVVEYPLLYSEIRNNPAFTLDSGRLVVSYAVYMDKNVRPDIYPEVLDIFRRLRSDKVHLLIELDYISVDNDTVTVLSTTNTDIVVNKKDIALLPSLTKPLRDWDYIVYIIVGWT